MPDKRVGNIPDKERRERDRAGIHRKLQELVAGLYRSREKTRLKNYVLHVITQRASVKILKYSGAVLPLLGFREFLKNGLHIKPKTCIFVHELTNFWGIL